MPAESAADESYLQARYGTRPTRGRRYWSWIAIALLAGALGAWLLWSAFTSPSSKLDFKDLGFSQVDPHGITISWQLTAPPGTNAECALQALNSRFGVVGWKIVEVPAAETRTRTFTERLRTSETAETGLIYRCWLT